MRKVFCLMISVLLIVSCGRSDQERLEQALQHARQLLTARNCSKAIEVLLEIGYQGKNPEYLSLYSSAQACSAEYDAITFFADLAGGKLGGVSSDATFMAPLTLLTHAASTYSPATSYYGQLKNAINTLLYAGDITSSSHASRVAALGFSSANNLNAQNLYMIFVQLGRYFGYYGNAGTTGSKGTGTAANQCITDYTTAASQARHTALGAAIAPCDVAGFADGHADLNGAVPAPLRKTRLCEGIVLFNNFFEVLNNITFTGGNTGDLQGIQTALTTLCTNSGLTTVCTVKDQTACEAETIDDVESFFVEVFEVMHR